MPTRSISTTLGTDFNERFGRQFIEQLSKSSTETHLHGGSKQAMTASKSFSAAIALAFLLVAGASPAAAEAGPTSTVTTTVTPAEDDSWQYDTYYIYPLTRHMDESEIIPEYWRYPLYPVTALLDTAQLPFGALAGLFGK
jgi:hypothetical protein